MWVNCVAGLGGLVGGGPAVFPSPPWFFPHRRHPLPSYSFLSWPCTFPSFLPAFPYLPSPGVGCCGPSSPPSPLLPHRWHSPPFPTIPGTFLPAFLPSLPSPWVGCCGPSSPVLSLLPHRWYPLLFLFLSYVLMFQLSFLP